MLCLPVWSAAQESTPKPIAADQVHEHVDVSAPALTPTRDSSGTSWLPLATPMYGVHRTWRGWDVRLDGAAFAQLVVEPIDRHRTGGTGKVEVSGVNWGMGMMRRPLGNGRVGVRVMLSAEPLTIRNCGALNLLSTGEVCNGDTIHDRQQPHDLLMELSADYEQSLGGRVRWQIYGGVAGEPALGPAGYPHRASSLDNPTRPITHHWIDATHVTFGVVTTALHTQRWKTEVSAFNGRDADDSRVDLDVGGFDSYSARVSYLRGERMALQVSAGRLWDASSVFTRELRKASLRATASMTYHRPLAAGGLWATTIAYAINKGREIVSGSPFDITSDAALLESSVNIAERHSLFARAEVVAMPAHHLHAHEFLDAVHDVGKMQVGYVRHMAAHKGLVVGLGGSVALSLLPDAYAPRYSGRVAPSYSVFANVRAKRHEM